MEHDLIIKFHSEAARKYFAKWLCSQGEQAYWTWMECREQEEPGDITVSFEYHPVVRPDLPTNDSCRYGPFLRDGVINTVRKPRRT